jgi:hypothetical protein
MTIGGRFLRLVALPAGEPGVRLRTPARSLVEPPVPATAAESTHVADAMNAVVAANAAEATNATDAGARAALSTEAHGLAAKTNTSAAMTHDAINRAELHAAMRLVADGQALRVTLAGFPWHPDQVPEIAAAARERGVAIIPTIAFGGGSVDIVVLRNEQSGD